MTAAAAPGRPPDTWRVCGLPVDDLADNHGCTCNPNDPTRRRADEALSRLSSGKGDRGA